MNINYKETQFELFPGAGSSQTHLKQPRFYLANLTLSIDSMVILGIVIMMGMILAFSIGVERGKRLTRHQIPVVAAPALANSSTHTIMPKQPVIESQAPHTTVVTMERIKIEPTAVQPEIIPASVAEAQIRNIPPGAENLSEKRFTVQLASYKLEKYAQQEAAQKKLKQLGHEVFVMSKGDYSIVCIGSFSSKDKAQALSNKLKKQYKDCLVRNL